MDVLPQNYIFLTVVPNILYHISLTCPHRSAIFGMMDYFIHMFTGAQYQSSTLLIHCLEKHNVHSGDLTLWRTWNQTGFWNTPYKKCCADFPRGCPTNSQTRDIIDVKNWYVPFTAEGALFYPRMGIGSLGNFLTPCWPVVLAILFLPFEVQPKKCGTAIPYHPGFLPLFASAIMIPTLFEST